MIDQDGVLVQLIRLIDRIPTPPPPPRPPRGRPIFYSDRLFLKALLIMIVKRFLHKVGELLAVLQEDTQEMQKVRQLLSEGGCFPAKRTFERRLKALPEKLPEQRSALWDATWWKCSSPGRVGEERWLSTVPLCRQKVGCGTRERQRSAEKRALYLTHP